MGKSSLVLLCCVHFMLLDQARANTPIKTVTIYGLEQGSHLKIRKHSTDKYLLQVGSFKNHANAIQYKTQITNKINLPVRIIPVKGVPISYRVIIGPISDAATLINISHQLLSKKTLTATSKYHPIKQTFNKKISLAKARNTGISRKKRGSSDGHRELITGYASLANNGRTNPKTESEAIKSGTSSIPAIPSFLSAKNINTVKASYLPLSQSTFVINYSDEDRDNPTEWQNNLLLGLAEREPRKTASTFIKGISSDLSNQLPLDLNRDNQSEASAIPSHTEFSYIETKESRADPLEQLKRKGKSSRTENEPLRKQGPLMSLASGADMTVQINLPTAADLQSSDPHISYDSHGTKIDIDLTHYNLKVYTLAYNVFIMNGNVGFAYKVATAAVKHDPQNILWREKLAQVSLWTGNAEVALDQWMYFINNNIDPDKYIIEALTLAKQLFNFDALATIYHRQLQQSPNDKTLLLAYNEALQKQGYPGKALKMLQKIPGVENDLQYLQELIAITKGTDNPTLEMRYLQRLAALDETDIKPKLEEAELLYSQGNLAKAYEIYHSLATGVKPTNTEFWHNYAEVALLSGNYYTAISAFKNLLSQNALNQSSSLQLVDLEQLNGQLNAAYRDIKIAYQKYHGLKFVKSIISLGTDLGKWQEIKNFIGGLSPQVFKKINAIPDYAMLIAITNRKVGLPLDAFYSWKRILHRWPNLTKVQSTYLWYLIDNNEMRQLEFIVKRWCRVFGLKPELWNVYVSALTTIGEFPRALKIMKQHYEQVNKSYAMLLNIADLFAHHDQLYSAYYAKRRALYLLMNEIEQHPDKISVAESLALTELMRTFAPAAMTYNAIVKLSEKLFIQPEVDDQIIAWALENDNYDLARYLIQVHRMTGVYSQPEMELTLALEDDNRDLMQELLFKSPKFLPHRDRVTAAIRTGNIKLAEEYAFQGLRQHPHDTAMYNLFTKTMLPRANKISASIAQETWGSVGGPLTKLSARVFVTPSLSLTPFGIAWFPHTNNFNIFATTPSVDETTGVIARKYVERGWWELSVAERRSLDTIFPVWVKWHRENVIPKLNTDLTLGYHIRADETTPLLLGGMKNEIKLGLTYNTDNHNFFDAQAAQDKFYGQDGMSLGSGQEVRGHWQHKFYLSYPDWNVNLYGTWLSYHYNKFRTVSRRLQRLIPVNDDPLVPFYMPISDREVALTFGFGQEYKEIYTHSWKPYAELGLLYSKVFHLGKLAQVGLATSIFGRDHLVLFAEYTDNQQQVTPLQTTNQQRESQVYYTIGMKYDYFF